MHICIYQSNAYAKCSALGPSGKGCKRMGTLWVRYMGVIIFGILCLESHVSGALWLGVELHDPGNGKFCVPFSPHVFFSCSREPGTGQLSVQFFTRGTFYLHRLRNL